MKWLISFLVVGLICTVVYELLIGLVLVMVIERYLGYTTVLEALQHACAIALGFLTSYKLYPPEKKQDDTEKKP